jgi:epsilon-lactone hydrolase
VVMGRRPGVATSSWPIATIDLVGLAGQMTRALARVPFRHPWGGDGNLPHNLAVSVTRETIRSFMGYSSSLPVDEFRSIELVLDDLCAAVLPPVIRSLDVTPQPGEVAGVPGVWYRPRSGEVRGTIVYLHGGGYVGTSPRMYGVFTAWLSRRTRCEVFVADLRLAPEFPFPAGLEDAVLVVEALLAGGLEPERLMIGGDSSGGGLVSSLLYSMIRTHHRPIAGALLFSPEIDLLLDEPSVTTNAALDILPWNIPTSSYLHGRSARGAAVSAVDQDVSGWPPTFVSFGGDEMFRDAIRLFVQHLEKAGVDTVAIEEPGMFHVFPILMPWAEGSRRVYRAVGDFADAHLPESPISGGSSLPGGSGRSGGSAA